MNNKSAQINSLKHKVRKYLTKLSHATHVEQHYKKRATIVLMAESGKNNSEIADELSVGREQVRRWRRRWAYFQNQIDGMLPCDSKKLQAAIRDVLSDEQRSGRPMQFTQQQVAGILNVSLQEPSHYSETEQTHWTNKVLRDQVIHLGIVDSISSTQVWRFLKRRERASHTEPKDG
jgi:transposase